MSTEETTTQIPFLPKEVDAPTAAFPGSVIGTYLPEEKDIPEEFKPHGATDWNDLFSTWFFTGLPQDTIFVAKEGIDKDKALRHINTCMRSFQPRQEHKEAGVAYLFSLWFEEVRNSEQVWN